MGLSRQEQWSGLPCPPPGDLSDPGTEPTSLMSPALAGRFFTTNAPWEALMVELCLLLSFYTIWVLGGFFLLFAFVCLFASLSFDCAMQFVGSQFPEQELNPSHRQQRKPRILTTAPLGNSLS